MGYGDIEPGKTQADYIDYIDISDEEEEELVAYAIELKSVMTKAEAKLYAKCHGWMW